MNMNNNLEELMAKTNINYNELNDLQVASNLNRVNKDFIKQTEERYHRYLTGIEVWQNHENLKDAIYRFLSLPYNTRDEMIVKVKLMRKIDIAFLKIINE